ncbi:STAS domain-containing protein [Spirillospora sp. NPDC050679]
MGGLELSARWVDGLLVVRVRGRVDEAACQLLDGFLARAQRLSRWPVVDVSGLVFAGSAGQAVLVHHQLQAMAVGGELTLVARQGESAAWVLGLSPGVRVYRSLRQAVAAVRVLVPTAAVPAAAADELLEVRVPPGGLAEDEEGVMGRWRSGDAATDAQIDAAYEHADRLRARIAEARAVADAERLLSDARELGLRVLTVAATEERREAQDQIGPALEQEDEVALEQARKRLAVALESEISASDDLTDHLEAVRIVAQERLEAVMELLTRLRHADKRATGLVHDAQQVQDDTAADAAARRGEGPRQ